MSTVCVTNVSQIGSSTPVEPDAKQGELQSPSTVRGSPSP
jgi:hypothetical protein